MEEKKEKKERKEEREQWEIYHEEIILNWENLVLCPQPPIQLKHGSM